MEKKDKTLRPGIDFTIKNWYTLPPIFLAFEQPQGVIVFTKLVFMRAMSGKPPSTHGQATMNTW